ncbi:SDR family NAD(P)-dependent oxidoreductase [Mesobacterium pallidum]|uniref:SDR family NAD(P)-dependent oxidoreductase n=1 Tax=Mesobacterium pallidum TaxID=2872037 RepID=UPI001EE3287F|nr:SDR family oxidoreductase [Mesobacterium pallidum]
MSDPFVLVTGAGGGLGRALSRALLARGARVAGLGRNAAALAETGQGGDRFHALIADVADAQAVRDAVAEAEAIAPLTTLINNAAVYPRRDFLDETGESFMATVATNLGGPVNCARAVLGPMTERGRGRILNVSTFADVAPLPASSAYAVSKGAQRILTRALIADICDRFPEIVINDWMPGMLATRMGIKDGLPPETAAAWGAELALMTDASLTGTIFEQNREVPPPRSLKGRIRDRLLGRKQALRVLG